MSWIDDVALGWDALSWEGEAQWLAKKDDWTSGGRLYRLDELFRTVRNAEALGWNLYLNLNPTRRCGRYARRDDVTRWRYACLDLDPPAGEGPNGLEPSPPKPWHLAMKIFSGRGFHFWLPVFDMPEPPNWAEAAMRLLVRNTEVDGWKADPTTTDLPRKVRCPGSINQRTGLRAKILAQAAGAWQPVEPPPIVRQEVSSCQFSANPTLREVLPHLNMRNLKAYRFLIEGQEHPGRRAACFTLIKTLSEIGIDAERAMRWAMIGAERSNPELTLKQVLKIIRQVYGR